MAEVVSAVASGITILGATTTTADALLNFINQVRNAPEEMSFLHNEVTDTRLILSNIKDSNSQDQWLQTRLALPDVTGSYGDPDNIPKAEYLIRRIERVLMSLDWSLRDVTKSKSLHGVTVHHGAWLLNRSKIKSLRNELQDLKTSVNLHFSASVRSLSKRSVVLLKRVLLENANRAKQDATRDVQVDTTLQNLVQRLAELTTLRDAQQQLMTLVQSLNQTVVTSEQRLRETITTTTTTTTSNSNGNNLRTTQSQSVNNHSDPNNSTTTSTTTTVSTASVSRLKLEFSRFQKRGCVAECECSCHKRQRYRSPSFAQKVLGELFVGFSNLPLLSKPCSDMRCKQRSPFSATITYYLPQILFKKMVSLICITTSQGDPAACLKIRPLSTDFSIYRAVETNDIVSVRNLLGRCAALSSATFRGGWTPLHYAISHGHTAICRTLLAANADPMIEDGTNQQSALEWAWMKILGGSYEEDTQREMEELFSDRDCLEEMGLTPLHRIVLGLEGSSITTYLAQNPFCINTTDTAGRTALSWAAERGMSQAVQHLLSTGADPNICTPQGHSPLQYAASARNPSCIPPLLAHGASLTQADIEGQTALHYAAIHQRDLAYYRPLVAAGAAVNARTRFYGTPLHEAIANGFTDAVTYLVEQGADVNLRTFDARPPIFSAVEYNHHAGLRLLYERGADCTRASDAWPTIAHVAAQCADIETLGILTSFRLELEGVECVDREGKTVAQIVERRVRDTPGLGEEFVSAFNAFLDSIIMVNDSMRNAGQEDVGGEESEEVFHDAAEELVT